MDQGHTWKGLTVDVGGVIRSWCERCGAMRVVREDRSARVVAPVWMGGEEFDEIVCDPPTIDDARLADWQREQGAGPWYRGGRSY